MVEATLSPSVARYPARLEGHLEEPSRWLWLIKWLLVIPHYVLLWFLWVGFALSSVVSFVAVLFTGRYPRSLFDFNVGVLRWTWRVGFYAFAANGTDRYPPFTLADIPDYPARVAIDYPEHQRRGLPLIGWWLAGIPQYIIAGVFIGSGGAASWTVADRSWGGSSWMGLIGLLVFVGVIVLLFRGEYPRSIFDLVLGLDRWVLRVVAYAAVMTPEYPPFRIDIGENDPGGTLAAAPPSRTALAPGTRVPWGPGRVLAVLVAAATGLIAAGLVAAGGAGIALDQTSRGASGYLMTSPRTYSTGTYALVSAGYRGGASNDWFFARDIIGAVRVRVSGPRALFVGIVPESRVRAYLARTAYAQGARFDTPSADFRTHGGGSPSTPPTAQRFWTTSATGHGPHTVTWTPQSGNWRIVVMNADGARAVRADIAVGARLPHLLTIAVAVLGAGITLLVLTGIVMHATVTRRV